MTFQTMIPKFKYQFSIWANAILDLHNPLNFIPTGGGRVRSDASDEQRGSSPQRRVRVRRRERGGAGRQGQGQPQRPL